MRGLIKTFCKVVFAVLGFAVGFMILSYLYVQLGRDGSDYMNGPDLEDKLIPAMTAMRFNDGRIIIHGTVENRSDDTFEKIGLAAAVSENARLIEECEGFALGPVKSKETTQFVINCQQNWKGIEKAKLQVEMKVQLALKSKRGGS